MAILVLGGYGNFGKRICAGLAKETIDVIIAGRRLEAAQGLQQELQQRCPTARLHAEEVDVEKNLPEKLERLNPKIVINTCGPFQGKGYRVAEACIRQRIHYIDLADGREFVNGITRLDADAEAAGICVISGASTVPGLSSAVLEHFKAEFATIESLDFGISPGQQSERGLATVQSILTYLGKPLAAAAEQQETRFGWQSLHRVRYPELGWRWMGNCDIPDLDLLPQRYGMRSIRFSAGMELKTVHFTLWALSWLVRAGFPLNLPRLAPLLLKASYWLDRLGTSDGGMHMIIRGIGRDGKPLTKTWFIIARNGDGPQIPCVPAIVLSRKLAANAALPPGAYAAVGLVTLEEYLQALEGFAVQVYTNEDKQKL